jgi:hypothetical protein
VRRLPRAALDELVLHEHRGGDLAVRDVDDRRGGALREPDRIEHEHVALEAADGDPALLERRDQVVLGDAGEQGEPADQRVVPFQLGW